MATTSGSLALVKEGDAVGTVRCEACPPTKEPDGNTEFGFAEVATLGGKRIKRLCRPCANVRGVAILYESRDELERMQKLGPVVEFTINVVSMVASGKARESALFNGVSLAHVESGGAQFSCAYDKCGCGISGRTVGETAGLAFVPFTIGRTDGIKVQRPLVLCCEIADLVVREATARGIMTMARPLDDLDLFLEKEQPVTITARDVPRQPAGSNGTSAHSEEPDEQPGVEIRTCSGNEAVRGDRIALVNSFPHVPVRQLSREKVGEWLGRVDEEFAELFRKHSPDEDQPAAWSSLTPEQRDLLRRERGGRCPFHCYLFKKLAVVHERLVERLGFCGTSTADRVADPAGQYTCPKCSRPTNHMFVGDHEVGVELARQDGTKVTPKADDPGARCKACRKRERREHNLAARRVADAAEMGRQHAVGARGDDTNRRFKKPKSGKGKK